MQRSGRVLFKKKLAGIVWQDGEGYGFRYDEDYVKSLSSSPISLTLPLRQPTNISNTMIPFFDGLIPEGWLLRK
jgi:serine/threonine-protein kinase HipA